MLVLTATGILIASPPALMTTADASTPQWFGLVRLPGGLVDAHREGQGARERDVVPR